MPGGPNTGTQVSEEKLTRFLAAYIENDFNKTAAALAIGCTKKSASVMGHRYAKAIRERVSMQKALAAAGINAERIALKLARLIDARKIEHKWNPESGEFEDFVDDDGHLQLDAAREAAKMLNAYPGEPPRTEAVVVNVKIDMPGVL